MKKKGVIGKVKGETLYNFVSLCKKYDSSELNLTTSKGNNLLNIKKIRGNNGKVNLY